MDSAYELFISEGFYKTTIAMITKKAGLGKGTFYLYFKDKEEIRDAIISEKSSKILQDAIADLNLHEPGLSFYDQLTMITDYIIDYMTKDKELFTFISTRLSWGLHLTSEEDARDKSGDRHADESDERAEGADNEPSEPKRFISLEEFISLLITKNNVKLKDTKLFIYSVIELVYSTCYNPIIYGKPVSIEEFKPYLHHMIKLLVDDQFISKENNCD